MVSNLYRLASQRKEGDPIHIRTLRVDDETKVIEFAERILLFKLADAAFAEIHQLGGNGVTSIVYGDTKKEWPKVKIVTSDVIIGPKPVIDTKAIEARLPEVMIPAVKASDEASTTSKLLDDEEIYSFIFIDKWRKVA